jgi:hypothetical protein
VTKETTMPSIDTLWEVRDLLGLGLVIHNYPDQPGTAAEFWPQGAYPPSVTEKLKAAIWCPPAGDSVAMDDPERRTISPGQNIQRR